MNSTLKENYEKQKYFFNSKDAGDILVFVYNRNANNHPGNLTKNLYDKILECEENKFPSRKMIYDIVYKYVKDFRLYKKSQKNILPDDSLPCIYPHYDIGI